MSDGEGRGPWSQSSKARNLLASLGSPSYSLNWVHRLLNSSDLIQGLKEVLLGLESTPHLKVTWGPTPQTRARSDSGPSGIFDFSGVECEGQAAPLVMCSGFHLQILIVPQPYPPLSLSVSLSTLSQIGDRSC